MLRPEQRADWLRQLPEEVARFRAELLLRELDSVQALRKEAKAKLLTVCQQHPDYARLLRLPGFGAVRVATLLAIVGTPQRFRTKRQFWPYCGFAVVTHSSADYIERDGRIVKKQKPAATRGLNRNHHPQLKAVFKGAALTALHDPIFKAYYERLVQQGTKPELARVAVARKLAAVALTLWQRHEDYDPQKVFAQA
jgi:transposase